MIGVVCPKDVLDLGLIKFGLKSTADVLLYKVKCLNL